MKKILGLALYAAVMFGVTAGLGLFMMKKTASHGSDHAESSTRMAIPQLRTMRMIRRTRPKRKLHCRMSGLLTPRRRTVEAMQRSPIHMLRQAVTVICSFPSLFAVRP